MAIKSLTGVAKLRNRSQRSSYARRASNWSGSEQSPEQVIALSAGPPQLAAEMLRGRLSSDGQLAAAKKANQRQGCNSPYTIMEMFLIPFNLPARKTTFSINDINILARDPS